VRLGGPDMGNAGYLHPWRDPEQHVAANGVITRFITRPDVGARRYDPAHVW
jgi:hypothetical protein